MTNETKTVIGFDSHPSFSISSTRMPKNKRKAREQIKRGIDEVSASSYESGDSMDEATKMLMERLERDSRERESRYHEESKEREQRYTSLTKEVRQEVRDRDERLYKELKDRESRMLKAIENANLQLEKNMTEIKAAVTKAEESISSTSKHVQTMVTQNFWGRIGAIVAALAICATVGATIWAAFRSSAG